MNADAPEILLLCMSSGIGGTEQTMRILARGLCRQGLRCEAWLPEPLQTPEVISWFEVGGAPVRTGKTFITGWAKFLAAVRFYRRYRNSVVNIHFPWLTPSLSQVMAIRLAGVRRVILSPHGGDTRGIRSSTSWAYNLASKIVVTSPFQRDMLRKIGVKDKKMTEVPLAVPEKESSQDPLVPPDGTGRISLGVMCRLVPLKRVEAVLRACASVPDFKNDFRLLIGGSGPEEERLRDFARQLVGVDAIFLGHISEPWRFYQSIDLFVLISELESFGLVYVEAATHGVPSIGCNNGGVPYAIRHGETGFLLDPDEAEDELRGTLQQLRGDSETIRRLGAQALEFSHNFSEHEFVENYLKVLLPNR